MAALLTAAATLALGAVALASSPEPAAAHGTAMTPGSRTYLCWKDGLSQTGEIQPNNPACSAAVAQSGANSLYNWFSVLRSDAGGRTTGFIPDGQLCSGGNTGFSGLRPGPQRLAADPPDRRGAAGLPLQQLGPPPGHVLLLRHQGQLEPDPGRWPGVTWRSRS